MHCWHHLLPGERSKQGKATLISPLLQLWAIQVVLVRAAAPKVEHTLPKLQARALLAV